LRHSSGITRSVDGNDPDFRTYRDSAKFGHAFGGQWPALIAVVRGGVRTERVTHHQGEFMKVKAAVAHKAGAPLTIETVDLEGPRGGEVLVEIKATGVCHTDAFTLSGDDPEGIFPAILGHEGAGIVVEVGAGVTSVKPGDHVIPLYTPECRQCEYCLSQKTNLCQAIRSTQGRA
jgi:hypothetical protein